MSDIIHGPSSRGTRQLGQVQDPTSTGTSSNQSGDQTLHDRYKKIFSRPVRVHFVGVWCVLNFHKTLPRTNLLHLRDTVSSVGIIKEKPLPSTNKCGHICFFRHALALDERRIAFLPEYIDTKPGELHPMHCKEVWFSGTHSQMCVTMISSLYRVDLL